ncbi:hypothetical protein BCV70DRAFT_200010 [Testicularia cyperi]|uniref:FUN14-domain-containing protein n=1 Tax=Testicularia cyperi TaxID=1882483 RepID=A0A317XSA1_9BASI|nr:hypothetical protein BCV70DRAFT_200010 [Testicularia cyperi]
MNSFGILRSGLQASHGFAASGARVGLGLRTQPLQQVQQARSYYGKKLNPKAMMEQQARMGRQVRVQTATHSAAKGPRLGFVVGASLIAATGLGLYSRPGVMCESARPYAVSSPAATTETPVAVETEPQSMVSIYQLSFGTVCGFCAGVFIKKGLKLIAFLLGGTYVLLQYMNSQRLVTVNWSAINSRYDKLVNSAAGSSNSVQTTGFRGSKAGRVWNNFTNFLMADFQPRATFMAGLLLGLRIG